MKNARGVTLRTEVGSVLAADTCSGCGFCAALDRGIEMQLDDGGYLRPQFIGEDTALEGAAEIFRRACPGRRVAAQIPSGAIRHPLLGPYLRMWEGWAVSDDFRHRGSSGGVLTALNAWLIESGAATHVFSAAASHDRPSRTVPVTITTRDEALAAAGSRYAPVNTIQLADMAENSALTGKPCEVSAVRAGRTSTSSESPILLSFFCAGTPSQHATTRLVRDLGGPEPEGVNDLWYRGRGWPGRFTAVFDGGSVSADYDQSWGSALGPSTQWRCKICPDGVGESADISAADSWMTDARGYPVFTESEGVSAVIARTSRGLAIVLAAAEAGVIALRPLDPARLVQAQPLQVERRSSLAARMMGARFAGRKVPTFTGFGLIALALRRPRHAVRTVRGAYRRVRAAQNRAIDMAESKGPGGV